MPKRKMAKTYPMEKLDEALHKKFTNNYTTEWDIIHGSYVTMKTNRTKLTVDERIFIDDYMEAVNDCMYRGALK